jgi:hypothetical protein
MKAKKSAKKPTMAEAFNAAQGPAVARPYGKKMGSGKSAKKKMGK